MNHTGGMGAGTISNCKLGSRKIFCPHPNLDETGLSSSIGEMLRKDMSSLFIRKL